MCGDQSGQKEGSNLLPFSSILSKSLYMNSTSGCFSIPLANSNKQFLDISSSQSIKTTYSPVAILNALLLFSMILIPSISIVENLTFLPYFLAKFLRNSLVSLTFLLEPSDIHISQFSYTCEVIESKAACNISSDLFHTGNTIENLGLTLSFFKSLFIDSSLRYSLSTFSIHSPYDILISLEPSPPVITNLQIFFNILLKVFKIPCFLKEVISCLKYIGILLTIL